MKKVIISSMATIALLSLPTVGMAAEFWKSGKINRILVDSSAYGKCMIQLSVTLGNSCNSNWVSLDCEGTYLDNGDGDRFLNTAYIAQTMDKTVSVKIDNSKKHSGYCVVSRIDLLK